MVRYAHVKSPADKVERYLPSNYAILEEVVDGVVIVGQDVAGWTLADYVIPRLQSGLHIAEEVNLAKVEQLTLDARSDRIREGLERFLPPKHLPPHKTYEEGD